MGLPLHPRGHGSLRRAALVAVLGSLVFLTGCSQESQDAWNNLAMPDPATEQAEYIFDLWRGAWIAALATGLLVWALIFWVSWRYRRRDDDEVPVQTRYNLPLEIFYTVAPIIVVVVFFAKTVETQNAVLEDLEEDHVVNVVGQQWSWTFNYTDEEAVGGEGTNVYTIGTGSNIPTLVIPVDQTTEFRLRSPDVVHNFGIPGFLMRMDVIPGRENHYEVTPHTIGEYRGKCYELCGTYHSRMLFTVQVVSQEDFEQHLRDLEAAGNVSEEPVDGGAQAGLDTDDDEEGSQE